MKLARLLALSMSIPAAPLVAQQLAWPDYRGPSHDGHSDAKGLPVEWSEDDHVVWKTRIHGRGWSSPVAADGEIWLTTAAPDGHGRFVLCVDLPTGKVLWDRKLFSVDEPQDIHEFNTYASPSPVLDGDAAYVTFGAAGTACIDRATREIRWQRTDLACNHFRGAGSSPLLYGDLLILTMDGSDQQYVIALDKTTGETKWRTDRSTDFDDLDAATGRPKADGDFRKGFSTPIAIDVDGRSQLISPGAKAVFAYDPRTGGEIWTVRYQNHSSASRSVYGHGLVFVNTGYTRPELLAIDPTGRGDVTDNHVRWRARRRIPNKPSPLLIGDYLYLVDDGGIASCVVAKTGAPVWHARIGGEYSASLVYGDGRIYACSQQGKTVVFAPGTRFALIAENQLDAGFMASPAVVGRALVLRTETHLYRIESDAKPQNRR